MFVPEFSELSGIPSAKYFATDVGFKWRLDLQVPFLGVEHEEKKSKVFYPVLEKKHFYWTDSFAL